MEFEETLYLLDHYISQSSGQEILLPNGKYYSFSKVRRYTESELRQFEDKIGQLLPSDYRTFLEHIGSTKCFVNRFGCIEFLELDLIQDEMEGVFEGQDNLYPQLLLSVIFVGRGEWAGFDLHRESDASFAVFTVDIYPEDWITETSKWTSFSTWLTKLVKSNGTEIHLW